MAINFKTIIEALLPSGAAWAVKSGSSFDGMLDGMSTSYEALRDSLAEVANVRDPESTAILEDLEHEYGIIPDVGLTEAERREVLKGIVYAKPGMGADHLTAELHKSGFTNLTAYQNDPIESPEFYIDGTWVAWCGGEDSFCGGEDAYIGYDSGGGGYLLVNDSDTDEAKEVPEDPDTWHLIFFVGGTKSDPNAGWFLLVDGDMEDSGVSAWDAGNDAELTKDAVLKYEGTQSLQVELDAAAVDKANYYSHQDLGVDALDEDLAGAPLMHDQGSAVLYDAGFAWADKARLNGENGDSGDVLGLGVKSGGVNASDKLAIDFTTDQLARFEGAVSDEGTFATWVKINDTTRDPHFDLNPGAATGYGDLPEDITINGITESPVFRYEAQDADATEWVATVGDDLAIAGSGSDPTFDALAPGKDDYRVKFVGGNYYEAASSSFAQPGTNDLVYEFIISTAELASAGYLQIAGTYDGSSGWQLAHQSSATGLQFYAKDGSANTFDIDTATLYDSAYVHLMIFVDKSGSAVIYTNGVAGTAASASSVGSLTNTSELTIGARPGGTFATSSSVAYAAMWSRASWLDTHLQADVAKTRAFVAMGFYPDVAAEGVTVSPTFEMGEVSGYANLDQDITINSVTKSPTFRYEGGSATASAWTATVGPNLASGGTGSAPVVDEHAPGLTDSRVDFLGGEVMVASDTSGEIGTDDFVWEFIYKHDTTAGYLFSKSEGTAPQWGMQASSAALIVLVRDASVQVLTGCATGLVQDVYYHVIVFGDRSGSLNVYIDGVAQAPVVISTAALTLTNGKPIVIGARGPSPYVAKSPASISYLAMWQGAGWLDTHLQADVAKERFYKASGVWPSISQEIEYITNGDFEAGTTGWTASSSGILSASTVDPYEGAQALRVTWASSYSGAYQSGILTTGEVYRITGVMRGDGTAMPRIDTYTAGSGIKVGTSSTTWQQIDETFIGNGSGVVLRHNAGSGGWVEFDNISVTRSGAYPTVASRASVASLTKLDSSDNRLSIPVGSGWMRYDEGIDTNDDKLIGYLPEPQATNVIPDSEGGGSWAKVDAGDTVTLNAATDPENNTTALSLTADSTDGNHGYSHASLTLTAATWTFSAWVRKGDSDHIKLEDTTVSNAYAYFNVSTGVVGTKGAGCSRSFVTGPWFGSMYRCEMTFTGTAAAHTVRALSAQADNDDTFAGDGATVNSYLWGLQLEAGAKATSRIATSGATATRIKDQLRFWAKENIGGEDVGQGRIECSVLMGNYDTVAASAVAALSDGGSSADRIVPYVAGTDSLVLLVVDGGSTTANIATTTDLSDGLIHTVKAKYALNDFSAYIDGSLEGSDTSGTVPIGLDHMDVGNDNASGSHLGGILSGFKVYATPEESYDGYLPDTATRNDSAYIEKVLPGDGSTALVAVGPHWIRNDRVFDKDLGIVQGTRVEPEATNYALYSEDFSHATWTRTNIASIGSDADTSLGDKGFDSIVADGTSGIHALTQSVTVPPAGDVTISIYMRAGNKSFFYVDVAEVTNGWCYFELGTKATSEGAGVEDPHVRYLSDGIYRLDMRVYISSTMTLRIAPAVSLSSYTFTEGSATPACYVYGAQVENNDRVSSYVATGASTATRVADDLIMHGKANLGSEDPTRLQIRTEHYGTIAGSYGGHVVDINDGSVDDKISIASEVESIAGRVEAGGSNQVLINGYLSTYTGEKQVYDFETKLNKFKLFKNNTQVGSTDTSGTMPTGLTKISVGQRYDSTLQLSGILSRLTISPYGLSYPRGIIGSVKVSTGEGQFIAYDDTFNGGCGLRASSDLAGEVQATAAPIGGPLLQDTWYHVAMTWDYAASAVQLLVYIDGVELGYYASSSTDPTISGDAPMILAAAAIGGEAEGGAVTISDPKSFSEKKHENWIIEEYNRGVPEEKLSSIISEYSSRPESTTIHDLIDGDDMTISGSPAEHLSFALTEAGRALSFGAGVSGVADATATAHPFLMSDDHTFEAWLQIEGGADQTIWTNQGAAGYEQELTYNATTEKLSYTCVIGSTEYSTTADIDSDRLTHVVTTRQYTGGNTTISIYIDGVLDGQTTQAGAPVTSVTYDDLTLGSSGSADYLYGKIQGIRLYDETLDATEVLARHDAGQEYIERGAYATQSITPTTEATPVTGWTYPEETAAGTGDSDYEYSYPVVLYKRTAGDNFRALYVGNSDGVWTQDWEEIDALVDTVYDIRFMSKNLTYARPSGYAGAPGEVHFDLLSGGQEGPSAEIAVVDIPEEKRQLLEKIIMRNKPLYTWAAMVVRYV